MVFMYSVKKYIQSVGKSTIKLFHLLIKLHIKTHDQTHRGDTEDHSTDSFIQFGSNIDSAASLSCF